jgi:hypothetical protein
MRENIVVATAILLCILVVGAIVVREKCRLGSLHWQACSWVQSETVHVGPITEL